jgi:hypothetical protein
MHASMKPFSALSAAAAAGLGWWRWILRNSPPAMSLPGTPKEPDTRLLELGAHLLQGKAPLGKFSAYLDGFHVARGDKSHQIEAHHYCAQINEDFFQAVIFDGNTPDARLIGVEYIITERLFTRLPDEERRLWHSHRYEVKSGQLVAPGLPEVAEHALMKKLVGTYGKTWHTWNTERDDLPIGTPELMMAFTADGQLRCALQESRDHRFGVSTAERREARADIEAPPVLPGADSRGPIRTVRN